MASRSWNRVELMGNLTRDPELRYTPNGAAVCTFGLATNRSYVIEGERREEVDFHQVVAWNKLAELCNQLLKKGSRVFISGRLQYREWEGQDGQKRRVAEIVAEDMIQLTPRNGVAAEFSDHDPSAEEVFAAEEPNVSEESASKAEKTQHSSKSASKPEKSASVGADDTSDAPIETVDEDDLPF